MNIEFALELFLFSKIIYDLLNHETDIGKPGNGIKPRSRGPSKEEDRIPLVQIELHVERLSKAYDYGVVTGELLFSITYDIQPIFLN